MTGRELVKKAVLFQGPERTPRNLPEPWGTDFLHVAIGPNPDFKPKVEGEDEWGCIWEKVDADKTMGQVKGHPLKDYALLDNFKFPDYKLDSRYVKIKNDIEGNKEQKFVLVNVQFSLIHRLEYLRGHEQAWMDPYLYPEELGKLLDRLADIVIGSIDKLSEMGVDGIMAYDDWGLQDRPILSPEMFNKYFQPRYKRVYQHAHKKGMLTFLHSCGYIIDLLPGFIDAGLNVIQMDQQENMGVENLSRRFGGKICFWSPVDIQKTMITGSLDDIRKYARNLVKMLGKFNGGFIAQWYESSEAVGHSKEKIDAMSEAFTRP
ncbi:MAG: hypothetical protein A2252_07625 [Elusimicrobia bacterium RIFOXYA2_FULL_39_19]|nr:MAG: hypothetical protein A2252_07625 [Elusimicrobia bacterium RIFOXYA2_FULL_39_19]